MNIFDIAKQNQEKAWQVIKNTNIIQIWEDAGAKINLVGSLRTGLLMKHRDIDFHIYSSPLNLTDSFQAMARLAENPSIKRIECANLSILPKPVSNGMHGIKMKKMNFGRWI